MKNHTVESILSRLKAFFDPHIKTSLGDWRGLASYLDIKRVQNRTTLKRAGEKESFVRFILNGGCAMVLRRETKDFCFDLCFEDEFLTDFESLVKGTPTKVFIRTFEQVDMVTIDRDRLLKIYTASSLGSQVEKFLAERRALRNQEHIISYLALTPEEWYRKLQQNQPEVLLRTPVHYLASYMGMSRAHLGRIRRRLGKR